MRVQSSEVRTSAKLIIPGFARLLAAKLCFAASKLVTFAARPPHGLWLELTARTQRQSRADSRNDNGKAELFRKIGRQAATNMKLQAQLGNEKHEVEVRLEGDKAFASVDGRTYELEVSEPEKGVFLFKNDGKIAEVFVSPQTGPGEPVFVQTAGRSLEITLIDPKRLRGSSSGSDHADGAAEIRTAMPGKVVRILVEADAAVEKGDGVIVVEAMKMQNELKAPKDGLVKSIRVAEGATVAAGEVLAVIE